MVQGSAELSAQPGEELTVNMIDGTALITANGESVTADAGTSVDIPMSEDLSPAGPPSDPEPVSDEQAEVICQVSGVGCPTPTPGGVAQVTNTSVPGTPGMPTNTSVPLATSTSSYGGGGPAPTNTSGGGGPAPTNTSGGGGPAPTNTTAPPTAVPPTATEAGTCSDIVVQPSGSGGKFKITNNYGSVIRLDKVNLSWPDGDNGAWIETILNGKKIDDSVKASSPATVTFSGGLGLRKLQPGVSWTLVFHFENSPNPGGYSVTLTFDVGCARSASQ